MNRRQIQQVAVALDGLALTLTNCERLLKTYREGDELELVIFRGDELMTVRLKWEAAPNDTCYLQLADDADESMLTRRRAWLGA